MIKHATETAHDLVTKYGMSEKLGPRTFGNTQELIFLGREMTGEKDYSETVGNEIDSEVSKVIEKTLNIAKSVVSKHRVVLDKIAKALMEKETLEQGEFYKIIKSFNLKQVGLK